MTASATGLPRRWAGRRALGETTAANLAILGLGAITGILTARILGPQGRGAYALAIGVSGVTSIIVGVGLQQSLAYTVSRARGDTGYAIRLSIWAAMAGGAVALMVGLPLTGVLIDDAAARDAVRLALLAIPLGLVSGNLTGVVQGLRWARPFNALRLVVPFVFMVALVIGVALRLDFSPAGVIAAYLAATSGSLLLALWVTRREIRGLRPPPISFARPALRYGVVVNVGSVAWQANRYLSVVVLAGWATLADVGHYSVAMGYALPAGVIAVALALHTLPDIASVESEAEQAALARRRLRTAVAATIPLVVVGVVLAPVLVPLAFGSDFEASVDTARILVGAEALLAITHVLSEISRGMGRPGLPALASVVGSFGAIGALPFVVPAFGIEGAAVTTLAVYGVMLAMLYVGLRNRLTAGP